MLEKQLDQLRNQGIDRTKRRPFASSTRAMGRDFVADVDGIDRAVCHMVGTGRRDSYVASNTPEALISRESSVEPQNAPLINTHDLTPYRAVKRITDVISAIVLLLVLFPLFAIIALVVVLTSRGSVLFKQTRLGHRGKPFTCYKFRSMVVDAESVLMESPELANRYIQQGFKIKDDPRVTEIGSFLRKSSLDELPQLLNVIRGDISMIGPRPIVPEEIAMYGEYAEKFLSVKPGLSGMWQACGRSDTTYDERIQLDMEYIDRQSLMLDLKLVFLTVTSVIKGTGAH